jgi:TolB-like protein/Tfp pilus assembly protein PilF
MSDKPSFFSELKRRNVYKVGAMYAVAGWLLVQVVTQVFPLFHVADRIQQLIVIAIIACFPLALVLSWIYELTPQGIVKTDAVPMANSIAQHTGQQLNRAIIGVLLLAVLMLGVKLFWLGTPAASSVATSDSAGNKSIAVLPFENLSRDPDNAYFAVGIQDEILTRLAKIGALKVISRTSTSHYASSPNNLPEIARQLGVANILEGSVQRAGDAVHINVQLIHAATDDHLWADTYDRKLDNIFGVEGEVAGAIADALKTRLSGSEQQELARKPTQNVEAYDAYLRAVAMSTDYSESRHFLDVLADLSRQATTADPTFAEAWASLGNALTQIYFQHDHTDAARGAATQAIDRALQLQPDLPEAWIALGYFRYWGDLDFDGALAAYAKASEKLPNSGQIHEFVGLVKRRQGRYDESLAELRKAAQLDPRNSEIWANIGFSERGLRHYDAARVAFRTGLEAQPENLTIAASIAESFLAQGNVDQAKQALIHVPYDAAQNRVANAYQSLWFQQRDYASAIATLDRALQDAASLTKLDAALAYLRRGELYRCKGDAAAAKTDFMQARGMLDALRNAGDNGPILGGADAIAIAALGDSGAAQSAIQSTLDATAKDAFGGPVTRVQAAVVSMLLGDTKAAVAKLQASSQETNGITLGLLHQQCVWDSLRADAGFQALLRSDEAAAK